MDKVSAVIVGAGHRAFTYASYAEEHPDKFEIVGVADPSPFRRRQAAERFGFGPENCFETAKELAKRGKIADAVINGTMDAYHVTTSIPLLEAGYDILLEKPFATSEKEMWELVDKVNNTGRKVMICHVLRYAPFYSGIKKRISGGEIGEIMNVQTNAHVSYHHMAVGYVRGKWNRDKTCGSSMLMAKCCHDLDIIIWLKSGVNPARVSSFGCNMFFNAEHAPTGSGTRCLADCRIEQDCLYSCKKHYIDHPERWAAYVWQELEEIEGLGVETQISSLKTDNPHGRCVWRCDNNVVDHQSVMIDFGDGCTATHNMVGGTARPMRSIHILGTDGEMQGVFENGKYVIRHINPRRGKEYSEERVDLKSTGDMQGERGGHGGGDLRLVADFVRMVRGENTSVSCTSIEDSINGHMVGFAADRAMAGKCVVELTNEQHQIVL